MTTTTNLKTTDRLIVQIPISEIRVDRNWNVRKFLGDDSEGGPDEHSFSDLMNSIAEDGQDTAVRVKLAPVGCDDHKYFLTEGFRRITAISKIYASGKTVPGLEKGCVAALVETHMTELQALIRNGRENTARQSLNSADTVFLVHRLMKHGLTQAAIARSLALSPVYVNACAAIYKGTEGLNVLLKSGESVTVFDHWRNAPGRVPFEVMVQLGRLKVDARIKEMKYQELITPKKEDSTTDDKKKVVQRNEFGIAETFGLLVGRLQFAGLVTCDGNWENMLKIGKRIDLTQRPKEYVDRVIRSAKEGFSRGMEGK